MTQALGDIRSGLVLLMALAVSGLGWWLAIAEPDTLPGFICGVAGVELGAGFLLGRIAMWVAMMLAMAVPVGVVIDLRAGRVPDAAFLAGYAGIAAGVGVAAAIVEWSVSSAGLVIAGLVSGLVAGAGFVVLGLLNLSAAALRKSDSCVRDDRLSRTTPPKCSPQGGGLNPAAPASRFGCERVPRVVSPLVGEMAGRPERAFLYGLSQGLRAIVCSLTMVGLQLALGTMSLALMLAMTLWMLAEALLPERRELPTALGAALIMAGLSVIAVTSVT